MGVLCAPMFFDGGGYGMPMDVGNSTILAALKHLKEL